MTENEIAVIEQLAGSTELDERVSSGFGELSHEQRTALRLRVIDERSYGEVSQALGVSEQAARARVSSGLRALRRVGGQREEQW